MPVKIIDEEYVTISEAAEVAQRSRSTIRRWIKSDAIKAHQDGSGRWLIDLRSLYSFLRGAE